MYDLLNYPLVLFGLSFLILWFVTRLGATIRTGRLMDQDVRDDFGTILASTLTLSSLIIGFSFSMAINRYEQRKNYEEAEANAIGTEYVRADLLPPEVLPFVVSISFLLIADIDSPRSGIIHVIPQNLTILADELRTP
jgi:hypothetical protein